MNPLRRPRLAHLRHQTVEDLRHLRVLGHADDGIDLGDLLGEFLRVTLAETAGDDHALGRIIFLETHQVEDGVDRFLLGTLDESAGIDHQNVRGLRLLGNHKALSPEPPEDHLGIDQVLGTAQTDHVDGDRIHGWPDLSARRRHLFMVAF